MVGLARVDDASLSAEAAQRLNQAVARFAHVDSLHLGCTGAEAELLVSGNVAGRRARLRVRLRGPALVLLEFEQQ